MIIIENKEFKIYDMDEINREKYVGFIYLTKNLINGKMYIGQHTKFYKEYLGSGVHLNNSIRKYGKENFQRKIIDIAKDQNELDEKEIYYIDLFNATIPNNNWYNIASGGEGGNVFAGKTEKELREWKEKISLANKGNNPYAGFTEEQMKERNKKASTSWKNKTDEEMKEHSRKISKANKGKNPYASKTEEEIKEIGKKMSASWKNKTDEEMKEFSRKQSEAKKGKNNHMYGKNHSEETRLKISESQPKRSKHHNAKKVITIKDNIIQVFKCVPDAADILKINGNSICGASRGISNHYFKKHDRYFYYEEFVPEEYLEQVNKIISNEEFNIEHEILIKLKKIS